MLVPGHVAVGLLLRSHRGLEVVMGVRGLGGHMATHTHARRQRALHEAMRVAQPRDGAGHGVGVVHVPGVRVHGVLGDVHVGVNWAGFLLHRTLGGRGCRSHGCAGCTRWHQP